MSKSIQFELWRDCNNHCKFCFLGNDNVTTPEYKIKNLNTVLDYLNSLSIASEVDTLSFIGGEFFQGQLSDHAVRSKFFEVIYKVRELLDNKIISKFWLLCTLTIGDQADLFEVLNILGNADKITICTSYDAHGRFHTQKMKDTWISSLQRIKKYDQLIKFNITTVLTGDFINDYFNGDRLLFDICSEIGSSYFLKPPSVPDSYCGFDLDNKIRFNKEQGYFFPTRSDFIKFMIDYKLNYPEKFNDLFNINLRCDYLYRFNERHTLSSSHRIKDHYAEIHDADPDERQKPCTHSTQYDIYVDSDKCAICDLLSLE